MTWRVIQIWWSFAIGNNSDEVGASVIIGDTELHNLDENVDSDIPASTNCPCNI